MTDSRWGKPRETVTLERAPANIPLMPRAIEETNPSRPALSCGAALAASPDKAHRIPVPQAPAPAAAMDPDAGTRELVSNWGGDAERNCDALGGWLESLPQAQRQTIEADPRANDPAYVQGLMERAQLSRPADMTIAGIERWMRTNRHEYDRNPEVQERLRRLYDERGE